MLKFVDVIIGFSEIPDEISLCINISNCPNNCVGCHSSYLKEDIGIELTNLLLMDMIEQHRGITCVCLMGGDREPHSVLMLARAIKVAYPELKVAWYSGKDALPECIKLNIHNFDYIKVGSYIVNKGGLDNPNTNQIMYEINCLSKLEDKWCLTDITHKFWKKSI